MDADDAIADAIKDMDDATFKMVDAKLALDKARAKLGADQISSFARAIPQATPGAEDATWLLVAAVKASNDCVSNLLDANGEEHEGH